MDKTSMDLYVQLKQKFGDTLPIPSEAFLVQVFRNFLVVVFSFLQRRFHHIQLKMDRSSITKKARAKIKKQQQNDENSKKKRADEKVKLMGQHAKIWTDKIIPNWSKCSGSVETKNLCSMGIPSHMRGLVWPLLIGNDFNVR